MFHSQATRSHACHLPAGRFGAAIPLLTVGCSAMLAACAAGPSAHGAPAERSAHQVAAHEPATHGPAAHKPAAPTTAEHASAAHVPAAPTPAEHAPADHAAGDHEQARPPSAAVHHRAPKSKPEHYEPHVPGDKESAKLRKRVAKKFRDGCRLERSCGKLLGVDCNAAGDGPYYYVKRSNLEVVERCGGLCMDGGCRNCRTEPKKGTNDERRCCPPLAWKCATY